MRCPQCKEDVSRFVKDSDGTWRAECNEGHPTNCYLCQDCIVKMPAHGEKAKITWEFKDQKSLDM